MSSELEQLASRTPASVIEALKDICYKRNLLALEDTDEFLHELRSIGRDDVAAYLTDNLTDDPFDWERYDLAIAAVLVELRKNIIR